MFRKTTVRFLVTAVCVAFVLVCAAGSGGVFAQGSDDAGSSASAKLRELEDKAQAHDFAVRRS